MLEKFTPEEIEQIKKELGILDERSFKSEVVAAHRYRLDQYMRSLPGYEDKDSPFSTKGCRRIQSCSVHFEAYAFTDLILENFEPSSRKNKYGNRTWKRSAYVEPGLREQYARVYGRLVDIFIEENSKMREKTKEEPKWEL